MSYMKVKPAYIYPIIIFLLIAYLLVDCKGDGNIVPEKPVATRTVDSTSTTELAKDSIVHDTTFITLPQKIIYLPFAGNTCPELDTVKVYYDSVEVDSSLTVMIIDSLRGHRLSLKIKTLYKPTIITNTITITDSIPMLYCPPKNQFYIGATINSNFVLGVQGTWVTKQGYMITAGYNARKETTVGVGIKLFKNK